jgi:hypothetical protein
MSDAATATIRLLDSRHHAAAAWTRVRVPDGRRQAGHFGGDARTDPGARNSPRLEGRLDLSPPERAPPGDRHRRRGPQAVPLPRGLAITAGPAEVRRDARLCGSESYAEQNESFGLATIQKNHVRLNGKEIEFDYPAKSGVQRKQIVADPDAKKVVDLLKRRRGGGKELLAYKSGGRWSDVGSADINEYIKVAARGDFSAKDFRTWNATVLAAIALAAAEPVASRTARKRVIKEAIKNVAVFLGNTPAVARSSYIDPRVFDRYLSGWTINGPLARKGNSGPDGLPSSRRAIEKAVLDLITERR